MQEFRMSGWQMNRLLEDMKKIQDNMNISYTKLERLILRISIEQMWAGEEVDAFLAYMELMKKYHGSFTERGQGEGSLGNPIGQALEALRVHGERVDIFYQDYKEYKEMESI